MEYVKPETKHTKLAYRALTISGLSFLGAILQTIFLPFILSPLAIIFSFISKGRLKSKHVAAKAATIVAIAAFILNLGVISLDIYRFENDAHYRAQINATSVMLYGITMDQAIEQLLETYGVSLSVK